MDTTLLVWPVSGHDDDALQGLGLRPEDVTAQLPTRCHVKAAALELGWQVTETTVSSRFAGVMHHTWIATAEPVVAAGAAVQVAVTDNVLRFAGFVDRHGFELLRRLAATCGPQVVSFHSGGGESLVTGTTAYADLKAAYALALEPAPV